MAKKALLMILDGWGIGKHNHGDVIYETPTPFMDHLNATYPHSQLLACGENVGLPEGRWETQRWVTSISVPAASFTRIW